MMTAAKRWMFCALSAATLVVAALQWNGQHRAAQPARAEQPLLPASMPYLT